MKKRPLLLAIACCLWPLFATAGFDEGLAAADKGDYMVALQNWQPLAAQGHATSQFNLGMMYYKGRGVPRDLAQAFEWFQKAASQGYARAQNQVAAMYSRGEGVPTDNVLAISWLQKAAVLGYVDSQYQLADRLAAGRGAPEASAAAEGDHLLGPNHK